VQPLQDLKVSVREDDGQTVVRSSALQISGDADATFSVEETSRVCNFIVGHVRNSPVSNEEHELRSGG